MEIQISHSNLRLIKAFLVLALVLAADVKTRAQALPRSSSKSRPSQITEWKDDLAGAMHFLHELFPDINPMSKSIILNNLNWRSSPAGTGAFTIYICEPDSGDRNAELQQHFSTRYDIQCRALTMHATFFMSGSPLGPVPREVMIGRPDIDERWGKIATGLVSHPEWSDVQIEDRMRTSGVKYGAGSGSEIAPLVYKALNKLEPFFGKLVIDSINYDGPILTDKSQPGPPAWVVKAHPSEQDKAKSGIRYVLAFNAFDGVLDSETRFDELGSSK